jgi:hypothetical protein
MPTAVKNKVQKVNIHAKVINVDSAKGPYLWRHSILMEDKDGNLFQWTTTQSGGVGCPVETGEDVHLYGDVMFVIDLHGGRTLTRVTRCKELE